MKKVAIGSIAVGGVLLLVALFMDTTVESGYSRVHNIGLISARQNILITGLAVLAFGLYSHFRPRQLNSSAESSSADVLRPCPYCAEPIKAQAVLCRFCGSEVEPQSESRQEQPAGQQPPQPKAQGAGQGERLSKEQDLDGAYGRMQRRFHSLERAFSPGGKLGAPSRLITVALRLFQLHQRKLAAVIFGLGVITTAFVLSRYSQIYASGVLIDRLRDCLVMLISGVLLWVFYAPQAVKLPTEPNNVTGINRTNFLLFGQYIDLIVFQTGLLLLVLVYENRYLTTYAGWVAALALAVTFPLFRLGKHLFAISTGVFACGYLVVLVGRSGSTASAMDRVINALKESDGMFGSYMAGLVLALAIPQLRNIRVGALKFGSLPGDAAFFFAGRRVYLNFTSVLVFGTLLLGIETSMNVLSQLHLLIGIMFK